MNRLRTAFALVLVTTLAGCAGAPWGASGPTVRKTSAGRVLVDSRGMTLYVDDNDPVGRSTCTGKCAIAWPPDIAPANAQPYDHFTLVTRANGARQWAYKGMPLYRFKGDTKPGDVTGNGKFGTWHVVHPAKADMQNSAGSGSGYSSMSY